MKGPVLLVEDEIIIGISLVYELQSRGYEVIYPVTCEEEVMRALNKHDIQIIIMDVHLARGENGVEIAEKIVAKKPLPIIFATGMSDQETMLRAQKLSPLAYLTKPLNYSELLKILPE